MGNTNQTNTDNQKWFFRGTIKTIKINSDKGVEIKVNYKDIFHTKYFLKYKCLDSSIITAELEEINEQQSYNTVCDISILQQAFLNLLDKMLHQKRWYNREELIAISKDDKTPQETQKTIKNFLELFPSEKQKLRISFKGFPNIIKDNYKFFTNELLEF